MLMPWFNQSCTVHISYFLWFIQLCVHILISVTTIWVVQTSLVKLTCNSKPERWSALLFDCSWFYCIGIQDLTVLYLFYYDTYLNLKARRWEISMAKSFSGECHVAHLQFSTYDHQVRSEYSPWVSPIVCMSSPLITWHGHDWSTIGSWGGSFQFRLDPSNPASKILGSLLRYPLIWWVCYSYYCKLF